MKLNNLVSGLTLTTALLAPSTAFSQEYIIDDIIDEFCTAVSECSKDEKPKKQKPSCTQLYDGQGMCMQTNVAEALGLKDHTQGYCAGSASNMCFDTHDAAELKKRLRNLGLAIEINTDTITLNGESIDILIKNQQELKQRVDGHDDDIYNLYAGVGENSKDIANNSDAIKNLEDSERDMFNFSFGGGLEVQGTTPAGVLSAEGCYNTSIIPGMSLCLDGNVYMGNSRESFDENSTSRTEDAGDGYTVDHWSNETVETYDRYFASFGLETHQVILSQEDLGSIDINANADVYLGNRTTKTIREAGNQLYFNGDKLGEPHNLEDEETVDDIMVGVGLAAGLRGCVEFSGVGVCANPGVGILIDTLDKEVSPLYRLGGEFRF